jgi:putative ATP-dependent endonuclease of OLD family
MRLRAKPLWVILTTFAPYRQYRAAHVTRASTRRRRSRYAWLFRDSAVVETDIEDLARYLDVTRAELVFARGVILVEGDAERYLLPAFADELGISLDEHGFYLLGRGTNFRPYVKLLCALGIPFAVITDYDEVKKVPRAYNRALKLVRIIDEAREGVDTDALIESIEAEPTYEASFERCEAFGIFVNSSTLETDMFDGDFANAMIETLREGPVNAKREELLDTWQTDTSTVDDDVLLAMIETIGKGRFAQRLATRVGGIDVPDYHCRRHQSCDRSCLTMLSIWALPRN